MSFARAPKQHAHTRHHAEAAAKSSKTGRLHDNNARHRPVVGCFRMHGPNTLHNAYKQGSVSQDMDKIIRTHVIRVAGPIPSCNYVQVPQASSQSLSLPGRYLYAQVRLVPDRKFVMHFEVATKDKITVRLSFSNIFTEFKGTHTSLQFPVVEPSPRWTMLVLDLQEILSLYLNKEFSHLKLVRMCSSMYIRDVFSSNHLYTVSGLPKQMKMFVPKGETWHDRYDLIVFPPHAVGAKLTAPGNSKLNLAQEAEASRQLATDPAPQRPQSVGLTHGAGVVRHRHHAAEERGTSSTGATLPAVGLRDAARAADDPLPGSVDQSAASDSEPNPSAPEAVAGAKAKPRAGRRRVTWAPSTNSVTGRRFDRDKYLPEAEAVNKVATRNADAADHHVAQNPSVPKPRSPQRQGSQTHQHSGASMLSPHGSSQEFEPNPALSLAGISGLRLDSCDTCFWVADDTYIAYACDQYLVCLNPLSGRSRILSGHHTRIRRLAASGDGSVVVTCDDTWTMRWPMISSVLDTDEPVVPQSWRHAHPCPTRMTLSYTGDVLATYVKDPPDRTSLTVWRLLPDTSPEPLASTATDADVSCLRFSPWSSTRLVSCGSNNVRSWRVVKDNVIRSTPIDLMSQHEAGVVFNALVVFQDAHETLRAYVAASNGNLLDIDLDKLRLDSIAHLHDAPITALAITGEQVVTGDDDGTMRIWPHELDIFALEASHQHAMVCLASSSASAHVAVITDCVSLGVLDLACESYSTVLRCHTQEVARISYSAAHDLFATASRAEASVRVWEKDLTKQLCIFQVKNEQPSAFAWHPSKAWIAVGYDSGAIRLFDVLSVKTLRSIRRPLKAEVLQLVFARDGAVLVAASANGQLHAIDTDSMSVSFHRSLMKEEERFKESINGITMVLAVDSSGTTVACASSSSGRKVALINPDTLRELAGLSVDLPSETSEVTALKCLPNSGRVAVGFSDGSLAVYDMDKLNSPCVWQARRHHRGKVLSLDSSSDGRVLLTGGIDKLLKVVPCDVPSSSIRAQQFAGHLFAVSDVAILPDNETVLSVSGSVRVWKSSIDDYCRRRQHDYFRELEEAERIDQQRPDQDPVYDAEDMNATRAASENLLQAHDEADETVPRGVAASSQHAERVFSKYLHYGARDEEDDCLQGSRTAMDSVNDFQQHDQLARIDSRRQPTATGIALPSTDTSNGVVKTAEALAVSSSFSSSSDDGESDAGVASGESPRPLAAHETSTAVRPPGRAPNEMAAAEAHSQPSLRVSRQHDRRIGARPTDTRFREGSQGEHRHRLTKRHQQTNQPKSLMQVVPMDETLHTPSRYFAPPAGQEGMKAFNVFGVSTTARRHVMWHAETGLLVSASGILVVLEDLESQRQKLLHGHATTITTLVISEDGSLVASASHPAETTDDKAHIMVWDVVSGTSKASFVHHGAPISRLAFSRDGCMLLSVASSNDPSIAVWDVAKAELFAAFHMDHAANDAAWDPSVFNEFATCGEQRSLFFWKINDNDQLICREARLPEVLIPTARRESFSCLAYAQSNVILAADTTGLLTAWSPETLLCLMTWQIDRVEITHLFSAGSMVLSTSAGGKISSWTANFANDGVLVLEHETVLGKQSTSVEPEAGQTPEAAIISASPDAILSMAMITTLNGTVLLVDVTQEESKELLRSHAANITGLACSESNHLAITADAHGIIQVWDHEGQVGVMTFELKSHLQCNCVSEGHGLVAAGFEDGSVRVFDLETSALQTKAHPHAAGVTQTCFTPDGRVVIVGAADGRVVLISSLTGQTIRMLEDHAPASVSALDATDGLVMSGRSCRVDNAASNLGEPFMWLAASHDRRISVWLSDLTTGSANLLDWVSLPSPRFRSNDAIDTEPPTLAAFSRSEPNTFLYTAYGVQPELCFYNIDLRRVVRTVSLSNFATAICLSPRGDLIALSIMHRIVQLMDYEEGSFQDFIAHDADSCWLRFSKDGTRLLSAGRNTLLCWDILC